MGPGAVIVCQLRGANDAELATVGGRRVICVRPKLTPERVRWGLLHELSEWHLDGRVGAQIEVACEALTACMVAPRAAFLREVREHGQQWVTLARRFVTSETCVALRYGEVCDVPIAVDAPTVPRARGPERGWHDEQTIRKLARAKTLPLGLRRERLVDDARRVVLLEDGAEG